MIKYNQLLNGYCVEFIIWYLSNSLSGFQAVANFHKYQFTDLQRD